MSNSQLADGAKKGGVVEPNTGEHSPILFCFCAPAGSGKSTVCANLVNASAGLIRSISTTTRAPRGDEIDGEHYYFVAPQEFERRVRDGAFVEHAMFGSHNYGTELSNIERAAAARSDLILTVDVQGVASLKKLYPYRVVTVFLFPPSYQELVNRLRNRASETEAEQTARLDAARREIQLLRSPGFSDYLLINDSLDHVVAQARSIVDAERLKMERYSAKSLDEIFNLA